MQANDFVTKTTFFCDMKLLSI